jgi:hypothetical protein
MGGWEPHWESALPVGGPGPTRTRTEAKEGSLDSQAPSPTGSHAPRRPASAAVVLLTRLPMPKRTRAFCVKRHNYSKCTSQLSAKPEVTHWQAVSLSVPGGMDMCQWTRGLPRVHTSFLFVPCPGLWCVPSTHPPLLLDRGQPGCGVGEGSSGHTGTGGLWHWQWHTSGSGCIHTPQAVEDTLGIRPPTTSSES